MDSVFQRIVTDHSLKKTCICKEKQKLRHAFSSTAVHSRPSRFTTITVTKIKNALGGKSSLEQFVQQY